MTGLPVGDDQDCYHACQAAQESGCKGWGYNSVTGLCSLKHTMTYHGTPLQQGLMSGKLVHRDRGE